MNNLLSVIMKNPFYTKYFIQNLLRNKNLININEFQSIFSEKKLHNLFFNILVYFRLTEQSL